MIKKIPVVIFLLIIIMSSKVIHAEGFKYVEIFDPKQAKVVKVVQLNTEINNMVSTWIKNIDGNIEEILEEAYDILKLEDNNEKID